MFETVMWQEGASVTGRNLALQEGMQKLIDNSLWFILLFEPRTTFYKTKILQYNFSIFDIHLIILDSNCYPAPKMLSVSPSVPHVCPEHISKSIWGVKMETS